MCVYQQLKNPDSWIPKDGTGRIIQMDTTKDRVPQILANNLDYQPFGPLNQLTYGNGLQQYRAYDNDYRLGQLIAELNALGETQANYIYRDSEPLAVIRTVEVQSRLGSE